MDPNLHEWLHLAARWIHVVAGVLWVGTTAFFSWMDRAFEGGAELWMIHSGGYYRVEKRKFVPGQVSPQLHWFKWEAAISWVSGLSLLVLVYYMNDFQVFEEHLRASLRDGHSQTAIEWLSAAAGAGVLLVGWSVYDLLWLLAFERRERAGVAVSFLLIAGAAFGLCRIFTGRAAYIHMGALFGTIMAANVWMRIIPGQRKIVRALAQGKEPDLALAERAKQRSRHNTFLAVPLILMMVSNHLPTVCAFGEARAWLMIMGFVSTGWIARALLNLAH